MTYYNDAIEILKNIVYSGENFSGYNKPKRTPKHAKNIKRGKMSAAYWADKVKW